MKILKKTRFWGGPEFPQNFALFFKNVENFPNASGFPTGGVVKITPKNTFLKFPGGGPPQNPGFPGFPDPGSGDLGRGVWVS